MQKATYHAAAMKRKFASMLHHGPLSEVILNAKPVTIAMMTPLRAHLLIGKNSTGLDQSRGASRHTAPNEVLDDVVAKFFAGISALVQSPRRPHLARGSCTSTPR